METKQITEVSAETDYLKKADAVVNGSRQDDYGDSALNFQRIQDHWSAILGMPISAEQFTMCMIAVKLGRLFNTPKHEDSWIDIAGYVGCLSNIHQKEKAKKPMV